MTLSSPIHDAGITSAIVLEGITIGKPQPFGYDCNQSLTLSFNFDPGTFKAGDLVSYRIPERFDDFPFVGILVEVQEHHVMISSEDPTCPGLILRGTREDRPVVDYRQLPQIEE